MIMNFKEVYKKMTDEIDTNKELLASIIEKSSQKKHGIWNFKKTYVLSFAAGLALVLTLGFLGNLYFGISKPDFKASDKIIAYDVNDKNKAEKTDSYEKTGALSDEKQNKDTFLSDKTRVFGNEAATYDEGKVQNSMSYEEYVASPPMNSPGNDEPESYDLFSETDDSYLPSPKMANEEDSGESAVICDKSESVNEEKMISSGGGGGGSVASSVTDEIISIENYWEYVGFNVLSKISLPYNIELFAPSSAVIKKQGGEIIYDVLNISGSSPDGKYSVNVYISKKSPPQAGVSTFVNDVYVGICSDTLSDEEILSILSF